MSLHALTWAVGARGISRNAKLVLICLAECHNKHTNLCFPDQTLIARDALMSVRTVGSCCAELQAKGFITRRVESKGKGLITHYTLHFGQSEPLDVGDQSAKSADWCDQPFIVGTNRQKQTDQSANPGAPSRQKQTDQSADSGSAYIDKPGSNRERTGKEPSVSKETAQGDLIDDSQNRPARRSNIAVKSELATKLELQKAAIFSVGVALMKTEDVPDQVARKFLGGLIKRSSVAIVHAAVQAAAQDPPIDARGYLSGVVEKRARAAGMRKPEAQKPGTAATDTNGELVDWDAMVAKYVRSGIWPRRLGPRPDDFGYCGTLAPLEAILANGRVGQLNVSNIRLNIDRLRAARAA